MSAAIEQRVLIQALQLARRGTVVIGSPGAAIDLGSVKILGDLFARRQCAKQAQGSQCHTERATQRMMVDKVIQSNTVEDISGRGLLPGFSLQLDAVRHWSSRRPPHLALQTPPWKWKG